MAEIISSKKLWTYGVKEPLVPTARQIKRDRSIAKSYQQGREMGVLFNFGNPLNPHERELVSLKNAIHVLDKLGDIGVNTPTISMRKDDPNHITHTLYGTPTEYFIRLLNVNKTPLLDYIQPYAERLLIGIHKASLALISKYNLPEISKNYLQIGNTINYDHDIKNSITSILRILNRIDENASFKIGESLKCIHLYFFEDYLEHVKDINLGTFILGIVDSWKSQDLIAELQAIMNSLPNNLNQSSSMKFLDRINGGVTEPSFWLLDTADFLSLVRDIYLEFVNHQETPSNSDYMNIVKVSILNLCYSCIEPKNRKFIRKTVAPTLFQKSFSKQTKIKGINYFRDRLLENGLFPKVGVVVTLSNYGQGHIYAVNEVSGDVTVELMDHENEPYFEQFSYDEFNNLRKA